MRVAIKINVVLFFSAIFVFNNAISQAQTRVIIGRVLDSNTLQPVIGAYIRSSENYAVISKTNGIFNLNTPLKAQENLTIKALGYFDVTIPYTKKDTFIIYLKTKSYDLDQVIVYSSAKKLVQKAIDKIPQNYSTKPFQLKAFKRIYNLTAEQNYFYQSDALFDIYYPGYDRNDESARIYLLMNKTIANRAPVGTRWLGYSHIQDFILVRPIFLQTKQFSKFKYENRGKTYYLGQRVFEIQFTARDTSISNSIRYGIMYLDTANLAFVGFDVFYGRREISGSVPVDLSEDLLSYQQLNNKWFPSFCQRTIQHEISNEPTYLIDYKVLQIDSLHTKRYKDEEILNYAGLTNFEVRREGNFDSLLAIYIPDSLNAKLKIRNVNNYINTDTNANNINLNGFNQTEKQSYYAIRNFDFSKIDTSFLSKSTKSYEEFSKSIKIVNNITPSVHLTLVQVLPYTVINLPIYNFLGLGMKFKIYKNIHLVFQYAYNLNIKK
ncbi:MAG: hypothetical protein ORN85_00150, partial [Sediminibacterium sp.]|nr:hypothetical protein [Sediminibacterium sp.]